MRFSRSPLSNTFPRAEQLLISLLIHFYDYFSAFFFRARFIQEEARERLNTFNIILRNCFVLNFIIVDLISSLCLRFNANADADIFDTKSIAPPQQQQQTWAWPIFDMRKRNPNSLQRNMAWPKSNIYISALFLEFLNHKA